MPRIDPTGHGASAGKKTSLVEAYEAGSTDGYRYSLQVRRVVSAHPPAIHIASGVSNTVPDAEPTPRSK